MRRARISSAARREASSSWLHAVANGAAGEGFGGRSGWSRKASFNCMTALLAPRQLDASAAESVDDLAQVKQIAESAEIVAAIADIVRRRSLGLLGAPIGPLGRNERPAAVRQDHENEEDAAPPDAADRGQRLAFEGVALAGDRYRIRNITAMGSLWPLPSMTVSQEWLIRFVEHRIGDQRIIRLIQKWLKAGVLEDGVVTVSDKGTGQGSVISPLLANIYLHYVLDLWAERWRRREATGDMIIVRYADDMIVGFEHEADARRFLEAMRERLREFALSLHPEKTRLIEFGRYRGGEPRAARARQAGDLQLPGLHLHLRQVAAGQVPDQAEDPTRPHAGEAARIKQELRRRMHQPIPEQGKWLGQVVSGYFNYHAVPTNVAALAAFRHHVVELWRRTLRRRSQKDRTTWGRITQLAERLAPQTAHPSSLARTRASPSNTQGGSRMRESRPYGSVRGALSNARPYRDHSIRPARPWRRAAWQLERVASFGRNISVTQLPAISR